MVTISSCGYDQRKVNAKRLISELVGKTMCMPKNVQCVSLVQEITRPDTIDVPFKILVYADSIGCTTTL